jgi:hypothetical protein
LEIDSLKNSVKTVCVGGVEREISRKTGERERKVMQDILLLQPKFSMIFHILDTASPVA